MQIHAENATYEPTIEDILWLKRAVEAEGEPRTQVAQALINKFMWARARLKSQRTLAQHVRAYASPVNPRWYVSGDKFAAQVASARKAGASPESLRRLRNQAIVRETVHSTRLHFRDETERAVEQALATSPTLRTATDYSAWNDEPSRALVPLTPPTPGTNRFYRVASAEDWPGYTVTLSTLPLTMQPDTVVALCIGLGIVIYLWSRNNGKR